MGKRKKHSAAVLTGTRAEYGLLRPVLEKMRGGGDFETRLLVTGAHLSPAHGLTVKEVEADAFPIAARLDILSPPAPPGRVGTARRTALCLRLVMEYLEQNPPDVLLALGDRYEMLAAGQAAALLGVPVAHISGGDVTAGADDDWFRHCLTKLSKLHFPSCEVYRQRIIRMGEAPGRVFNVGGLGDENIRNMALPAHGEIERQLGFSVPKPYALVTLHPETASPVPAGRLAGALLTALEGFGGLFCLFTGANADAGGDEINEKLRAYCAARAGAALAPSLGAARYLGLMRGAAAVVGNSSSGIAETPSFGVPAVDIGQRQAGRLAAVNILRCAGEAGAISAALGKALSPDFAAKAAKARSPYNGGDTSGKIVALLRDFLNNGSLLAPKVFYDAESGVAE